MKFYAFTYPPNLVLSFFSFASHFAYPVRCLQLNLYFYMQYVAVDEVVLLLRNGGDGRKALRRAAARFPDVCKEPVDEVIKELQNAP